MNQEGISGILDELEDTDLKEGDSLGLTFLFDSAHKAQFRIKHFEDYARKVAGRVSNHDRVVIGPKHCWDDFGKYLLFMSCSPDARSHEGFMFSAHPVETDGWASFQYTGHDLDTVMDFLVDDLPDLGNLFEISQWDSCLSVESLRCPTREAVLEHFDGYDPVFEDTPSPVSKISHELLLAFYAKGWNLYKDIDKDSSKIIKQGPVNRIWLNKAYHLLPVAIPNKDVDTVEAEIIKMKELNEYPSWVDGEKRTNVTVVSFDQTDVKFLIRGKKNLSISVPYWDLDRVLDEHLFTYDSQK